MRFFVCHSVTWARSPVARPRLVISVAESSIESASGERSIA